jgi:hypothetical protein
MYKSSFGLFAVKVIGIIIVNYYFVWKPKYYFLYILLHKRHIKAHPAPLSSSVTHQAKYVLIHFLIFIKHMFDICIELKNKIMGFGGIISENIQSGLYKDYSIWESVIINVHVYGDSLLL